MNSLDSDEEPLISQKYGFAFLSYNKKEQIHLRVYSTQKGMLYTTLGGFLERFRDEKHNEILYLGKVKYFNKLDYKTIDEKTIDKQNTKIFRTAAQLGGNMESYLLISRAYIAEKNIEKKLKDITSEEAEKLVNNKEAEFKTYLSMDGKQILSYKGRFLWKDTETKSYIDCG